jgi:hypothetical protein
MRRLAAAGFSDRLAVAPYYGDLISLSSVPVITGKGINLDFPVEEKAF